ncbi:MAG: ATP-grasp domain-containing protein [Chitinophagaceae bacterium]|nr:MAG: ATP-grasp domain-containing protein [Chitinophagaceae bacterium]
MKTPLPEDIFPAVLFQSGAAPAVNGIVKPMKENGYADSGADIGYALMQAGIKMVLPSGEPHIETDREWVFPDNREGIRHALDKNANLLWLNTVLYKGHPVEEFMKKGLFVVGQDPTLVEQYDDKWMTSELLGSHGIPVPEKIRVERGTVAVPFGYPFMLKPIRGRGSQGVYLLQDEAQFRLLTEQLLDEGRYGTALYAEPYLPGQEITVTVMPPGRYFIFGDQEDKETHWCLTAVRRFNHIDGVAPYNALVPIVENSRVISADEHDSMPMQEVYRYCARAAAITGARAPVRIDCRQDMSGKYRLFDLNMKPNMTGPSRPHRFDQDSLVALAAADLGWDYTDLLVNMLYQRWRKY